MSEVRAKINIDAAPEQVYDVMLDPSRLHEWVTIHRKVNRADSGKPREGFEMDQTLCLRHANFKVHWTLTDAERPHRATWEGRPRGFVRPYQLSPHTRRRRHAFRVRERVQATRAVSWAAPRPAWSSAGCPSAKRSAHCNNSKRYLNTDRQAVMRAIFPWVR